MQRNHPSKFVGGKGPRQRIWDNIRAWHKKHGGKEGPGFTRRDVLPKDVPEDTCRDYLRGLEKAGIIATVRKPATGIRQLWILVKDMGIEAPRIKRDGTPNKAGLAQEQMWRTLRTLKGDTNARELAAHAATAEIPVAPGSAIDYLAKLWAGGYVQRTKEGGKGRRHATLCRYRLISNTGPLPPIVCKVDSLYDPNLGKVVWMKPVTEEDAIYGR